MGKFSDSQSQTDPRIETLLTRMNAPQDIFTFSSITNEDIFSILNNINQNKGSGPSNIPIKFLKDAAYILTPHLTYITNQILMRGDFPDVCKKANVTALHKK